MIYNFPFIFFYHRLILYYSASATMGILSLSFLLWCLSGFLDKGSIDSVIMCVCKKGRRLE